MHSPYAKLEQVNFCVIIFSCLLLCLPTQSMTMPNTDSPQVIQLPVARVSAVDLLELGQILLADARAICPNSGLGFLRH